MIQWWNDPREYLQGSKDCTINQQAEKIERLQATLAKQPRCWRLNETGKLVQDRVVEIGMVIYYPLADSHLIIDQTVRRIETDEDGDWLSWGFRTGRSPDDCYDSCEAAEAGKEKSDDD